MKKFSTIMIALIFLCLGGTTLAAEWELGHESDFLLTEQAELDVILGVQGVEGYRVPLGFGEARFTYWGSDPLMPLRFLLSAGQYGTEQTRLSGAYMYPVTKGLDLQVGLHWERNQGIHDELVSLQGNWQTDYGLVQLGMMGGTRESAHIQYEGEAQLLDWLALQAGTGVRYEAVGQDRQWTVPVGITLNLNLAKNWDLKFAAEDAFPLGNQTDRQPLQLGLYVKTTFDLRRKQTTPNENTQVPEPMVEEIQPEQPQPTDATSVAVKPGKDDLSTVDFGPVETIEVVKVGAVDVPTETSTTTAQPDVDPSTTDVAGKEPGDTTETATSQQSTETVEPVENPDLADAYDPVTGELRIQGMTVNVVATMEGGQAYIPIRHTVELLGGQVYWYGEPRQICIVLGEVKVLMLTRESMYMRNGETRPMDDELKLWDGHYYVSADELIRMVGQGNPSATGEDELQG